MSTSKPELIFTIDAHQCDWKQISDTVKRISAEYSGEDYILQIKINRLPCYSDADSIRFNQQATNFSPLNRQ